VKHLVSSWLASAVLLLSSGASAQDPVQVEGRIDAELACLRAKQEQLGQAMTRMEEARRQLRSSQRGSPEHRDAARAIATMEERITRLLRETSTCLPEAAERASGRRLEVVYESGPRDPVAERVATPNPPTQEVERGTNIADGVRIVLGEQTDGTGRLEAHHVQEAFRRVGGRISACYDVLVDRGTFERGRAIVSFRVESGGRVIRPRIEQLGLGDGRFRQCLQSALGGLRIGVAPVGGFAEYSYTLSFGDS